MAKERFGLKVGDLVEVWAYDHTSDDSFGWGSPEELARSTPWELSVAGYYIGEDKHILRLGMSRIDQHFGTVFNIVKSTITRIRKAGV